MVLVPTAKASAKAGAKRGVVQSKFDPWVYILTKKMTTHWRWHHKGFWMKMWRQQAQPWISESAIFIQICILPKNWSLSKQKKILPKHRHHWIANSFSTRGAPEDLVLFENFKQTIILCNHFHFLQKQLTRPAHVKAVLSFVGIHPIIGIFGPSWPLNIAIEMAPVLSWWLSSRTITSGVCQDSFRNPRAGKSRICQVSICRFD